MHFVVVVLGDVGRSPRMQYHTLSLLQQGHTVSLVGYSGEDLIPELSEYEQLQVVRFSAYSPKILRKLSPLYFALRLLSLVSGLGWNLWVRVQKLPDCVLVQNPPAIPLLLIAYVYCWTIGLRRSSRPKFVIDWHNLGYSMLRKDSVFQKIAYWYERTMAPLADGHLCVTKAMKDFLIDHFGVVREISVLYDCPPGMFRPLTIEEQHEAMLRIQADLRCPWTKELTDKETFLTEERRKGEIVYRKGRPALITSSTSWTEDEDFGILLDALVELDHKLDNLRVLVLVTGKGPMKEMFEEKISKLRLENVFIDTLWLAPRDYPKLLACADVGISLHGSTSGKDLPMKVLDLFGCETPVCALHFDCISELLQDNVNGRVFYTSEELVERLHELLMPLQGNQAAPHSLGALSAFSENIKGQKRWRENWMEHAMPLLTS